MSQQAINKPSYCRLFTQPPGASISPPPNTPHLPSMSGNDRDALNKLITERNNMTAQIKLLQQQVAEKQRDIDRLTPQTTRCDAAALTIARALSARFQGCCSNNANTLLSLLT